MPCSTYDAHDTRADTTWSSGQERSGRLRHYWAGIGKEQLKLLCAQERRDLQYDHPEALSESLTVLETVQMWTGIHLDGFEMPHAWGLQAEYTTESKAYVHQLSLHLKYFF